MQRFRGGLVCKAHRLLYHSTLGLGETKKRRKPPSRICEKGDLANLAAQLEAIHLGHEHVRNHNVELALVEAR